MTAEEIRGISFEQVRKGYRMEDVDDFLEQVAQEIERLEANLVALDSEIETGRQPLLEQVERLEEENRQLAESVRAAYAVKEETEAKMYVLAEKVEEYRGQEDTLKSALINAQRLGETVVHEAKQKADQMLREAGGQAELLQQRAEQEAARERRTLESLTAEVGRFKTTILNLYKQHIEALSALDPPINRVDEYLGKESKDVQGETSGVTEMPPVLGTAEPELPEAQAAEREPEPEQPVPTEPKAETAEPTPTFNGEKLN